MIVVTGGRGIRHGVRSTVLVRVFTTAGSLALLWCFAASSGLSSTPLEQVGSDQESWLVRRQKALSTVTGLAYCGDMLVWSDTRREIHRYNTTADAFLADLAIEPAPVVGAMDIDCARRRLFLLTIFPTFSIRVHLLDSGTLQREYVLPSNFLPRPEIRLEAADRLFIAGLWTPTDRPSAFVQAADGSAFYDGSHLGATLSFASGVLGPVLVPYEHGCIGGGRCPDVRLDSAAQIRVAALPTSASVAVYSAANVAPRLVDIRSDRFARNGQALPIRVSIQETLRWRQSNTVIERVFAFPDAIAVIQSKLSINRPATPGATPEAFLNVYSVDGKLRFADRAVPSPDAASDGDSLFVVDYGSGDKRDELDELRFVKFRM